MNTKKICTIYFTSSVVLGVLGAIFMLFMMISEYDIDTNAFGITSGEKTFLSVFFVIAVIIMLSAVFVLRKAEIPRVINNRKSLIVPVAIMAVSSVAFVISLILENGRVSNSVYDTALIIYAPISVLCTLYFVFCILKNDRIADILSISFVIWAIFLLGLSYFSPDYTYDLITRVILDMALCATIAFALTEMRLRIGMTYFALRMAFGCAAIVLGGSYTLSRAIFVIINGAMPSLFDVMEMSLIGVVVYIIIDNITLLRANDH